MKKLLWIIVIITSIAFGAYLGTKAVDLDWLWPSAEVSSIDSLLVESSELHQMFGSQMVYRFVFPHDFIPQGYDRKALGEKIKKIDKGQEVFLTDTDKEMLSLFNLCIQGGVDPLKENQFLVLERKIKAGWDFTAPNSHWPPKLILEEDSASLQIFLPSPSIQWQVWQDKTPEEYPYPDIPVSPKDLAVIYKWVEDQVSWEELTVELLRLASEEGIHFWIRWAEALGYSEVEVLYDSDLSL